MWADGFICMNKYYCFTSESVAEGHPDKLADQVSDAVLDAILSIDSQARVAVETLVKTGLCLLAGELRTDAVIDFEQVVRQTIVDTGYDCSDVGFDGNTCAVINVIGKQSADISMGVDASDCKSLGAGDQGMMFGYATDETDSFMPAPIHYAHRLVAKQAELRKAGKLPWLRPDAKSQITMRYDQNKRPVAIDTVVLSTQHSPDISLQELRSIVRRDIIEATLPSEWLQKDTIYHINPTGNFEIGGPVGDCGLTGRKIIVDTYGGMARHGGGAFSGKDPSKVDRSAAYAARYVAKNIVVAGLASRCEVQISYAIGVSEPTSISIDTFGTGRMDDSDIENLVEKHFDLSPAGIIEALDLCRPIYRQTATYGHFGRQHFSWECADKKDSLAN